jgi:phospholipase C
MKLAIRFSMLLAFASTAALGQIPYPNPFTHVIIVDQENRTVDNLLGSNSPSNQFYLPGLNFATSGRAWTKVKGKKNVFTVQSVAIPLASKLGSGDSVEADDYDPGHGHKVWVSACDSPVKTDPSTDCTMDGFNHVGVACDAGATGCPGPAYPTYAYVQYKDVAPYFQIAAQYSYANYMFQTNQGPSFPSHQFTFGGTSQPGVGTEPTWFVAENMVGGANNGCIASSGGTVALVDPANQTETTKIYPCFTHRTMADLFAAPPVPLSPVTWTYYTPGQGSLWSAPDAISTICTDVKGKCTGPYWTKGKTNGYIDVNPADAITDINNCNLKQMSWIIPTGVESDHAGSTDGSGPSWVSSIVNAVGGYNNNGTVANTCGYWNDTVILITWDDWGGWYDHVVPPPLSSLAPAVASSYVYGFRVPLFVVSAYTPPGTVGNVMGLDYGAMLKFVEETFGGLGTISEDPSNPYADYYANDDLSEFFQFGHTPYPFQLINAPLNSDVFLNPARPIDPPDND